MAELAAGRIDAEARRHHRLAPRGGEQEFLVRAYGHRRRARRLDDAGNRDLFDRGEVAVRRIELKDVDFVAVGAADIDERRGARRHHRGRERKCGGERHDRTLSSCHVRSPGKPFIA
jgi:hypothetical protein